MVDFIFVIYRPSGEADVGVVSCFRCLAIVIDQQRPRRMDGFGDTNWVDRWMELTTETKEVRSVNMARCTGSERYGGVNLSSVPCEGEFECSTETSMGVLLRSHCFFVDTLDTLSAYLHLLFLPSFLVQR